MLNLSLSLDVSAMKLCLHKTIHMKFGLPNHRGSNVMNVMHACQGTFVLTFSGLLLVAAACAGSEPDDYERSSDAPGAAGGTDGSLATRDSGPSTVTVGDGGGVAKGGPAGSAGASSYVCKTEPKQCADIGPDRETQKTGCCVGYVNYFCTDRDDGLVLKYNDCSTDGSKCAFDPKIQEVHCVLPAGGGTGDNNNGGGSGGMSGAATTSPDASPDSSVSDASEEGGIVTSCSVVPKSCQDIGASADAQGYGCCADNFVYYCDPDDAGGMTLNYNDCANKNRVCGYKSSISAMGCIAPL